MADIFISYSRKDSSAALELARRLRTSGMEVWIDQHGLEGADSWSKQIVGAIDGCTSFLLLLSRSAIKSENVVKELSIAFEAHKPIIPVELEPIELTPDFRYQLAGVQRVALSNYESVLRAVQAVSGEKRTPFKADDLTHAPLHHRRSRFLRSTFQRSIAAFFMLAVAVVIYILASRHSPETSAALNDPGQKASFLSHNSEANALRERAIVFHSKGTKEDLENAFNLYEAAIAKDSNFALAYADLAIALIVYNQWDSTAILRATDAALKAILLNSQLPSAYTALSTIRWEQGRISEAIANQRKALELDPRNPQSWSNLGSLYEESGQPGEADSAYHKSIEASPDYIYPYLNVIAYYFSTGNVEQAQTLAGEAKKYVDHATLMSPDNILLHVLALCNESFRLGTPLRLMPGYAQFLTKQQTLDFEICGTLAMTFSVQHELDSAFRWLERPEVSKKDLSRLQHDFAFQSIVKDRRFGDLLARKEKVR